MNIRNKTKWMYVGGSEGYALIHTVGHIENGIVNAWSDVEQGKEDDCGYAWAGPADEFLRNFKPVGFQDEAGV